MNASTREASGCLPAMSHGAQEEFERAGPLLYSESEEEISEVERLR